MTHEEVRGKIEQFGFKVGHLLYASRRGVVLGRLEDAQSWEGFLQVPMDELLELHAFDSRKEFRVLQSTLGWMEHLAQDDGSDYYDDEMVLYGIEKAITVRNYIDYEKKTGMLQIVDYRIFMKEAM